MMTESRLGQIEDPSNPITLFFLFFTPLSSPFFPSPLFLLIPLPLSGPQKLVKAVLAALNVAGRSALWIRRGSRQDYKQQVMSGKHDRPAPI